MLFSFPGRSTCGMQKLPETLSAGMRAAVLLLALGPALSGGVFAAGDVLGFEQALRLAEQRSRQPAAQDAAARAAREMSVAAAQLPDPVLKGGVNNLPIEGRDSFSLTGDFMTMRSIGVMQEFTGADKRRARAARYDREAELAESGRALAVINLQRDTATAWLERHYEERTLEVLQAQRAETALQVEAADAAYRSGRGSQADVFAARSALAQIDDRIRQTQRQLSVARTRLARWVGDGAALALGEPPVMSALKLDPAALGSQLLQHPQIALMRSQEAVARADAEIALAGRSADWSAELMYSKRGPNYDDMVSINFSIPLQFDQKNRQDRELAARLAGVEQVQAEREEVLRERLAETLGWLQAWQGNRDRLAHYDATLQPLAAERSKAALAAYRGGGGPLDAVLEARRAEIDVRMERLRLELETAVLWVQLNFLLPDGQAGQAPGHASVFTEK
ncbi:MAG TPA: TolC family protein [Methyloversatilis sp.]